MDYFKLLGLLERAADDESDNETLFQEVLSEAMLYHNLSARQVADQAEACVASVRRWIKGTSFPRESVRKDIVHWLISVHTTKHSSRMKS